MKIKDFLKYKNFYLVGIKGGGMTALALLLQGMGKEVRGSDTSEVFFTDKVLKSHGIEFIESFDDSQINSQTEAVIYSTAYSLTQNSQLKKAQALGLTIFSYPQALGEIIKTKNTIAVAGTHGKTTVTALLGYILMQAGLDPSVIVGSDVKQFGGNTLVGKSDILVAETDEYQNKLQHYSPKYLILNNIDWDHPDFFDTPANYFQAFSDYVTKLPYSGWLVANLDDVSIVKLIKQVKYEVMTYSLENQADWQGLDLQQDDFNQYFKIFKDRKLWAEAKMKLFGEFNVRNALAGIIAADKLGVDKAKIISALENFAGTARRFEIKGEHHGSIVVDDFAHHPGEIQATLKMARNRFKDKKIYVAFHPHTFTRTDKLQAQFAQSFYDCDEVVVLDIYASAREKPGAIDSQKLVELINSKSRNAKYLPTIKDASVYFKKKLDKNCVLITMGAGDVWRVGEDLISSK